MINTVCFDLDGTLLPMDNEEFTKGYFKLLAKKLSPLGYQTEELIKAVWSGTAAMVRNDGSSSNEDAFWRRFAEIAGERVYRDRPIIEDFYRNEFNETRALCGCDEMIPKVVKQIKSAGYQIALATNPFFPAIATESRIRWAGFEPSDFEIYTTYENIGYCKPNTDYYIELMKRLNVSSDECLMVGNDVSEDMIAETVGMNVFLLTDNIINKDNKDISAYPQGSFVELLKYLHLD